MSNSPFEFFRRKLKFWMVVLTGLALFAFVVLPVVDSYMRQNARSGGTSVVASFDDQTLTRDRVEYFTRNHNELVGFLLKLAEATIARGGVPRTAGFQYDPRTQQIQRLGINQNPNFEGSIRTLMFAAKAKDAGFELDDSAIQLWLERFTDGIISDSDVTGLLMTTTQNRMGRPHLYEQLRNHLLADVYMKRGYAGLYSGDNPSAGALMTPAEQWEAFVRLNRSATIDAYAVLVSDYVDKTEEVPPEAKIQQTYQEGKDRVPDDQSPEPAFRRRYQATFEYVVANLDKFIDEEVAKLSEEEIRAEYEKQVEGGAFVLPDEAFDEMLEEADQDEPATDEPGTVEPGDEEPADSDEDKQPTEDDESVSEDKSSGDDPAADDEAELKGSEEADEPTEKPAEEMAEETNSDAAQEQESDEGREQPEDSADDPPSETDSASTVPAGAVMLTAVQEDDQSREAAEGSEVSETESTADESEAAKQQPDDDAQEDDAKEKESDSADDSKPDDSKPEQSAPAEAEMEEESADSGPAKSDDPAPADSDSAEPVGDDDNEEQAAKVQPFEEVRDQVARRMVFSIAQQRIQTAADQIADQMQDYFTDLAIHESNIAAGQAGDPPQRPDLEALAEESGFKYQEIGPHDRVSISADPISTSMDPETPFGGRGPNFTLIMYGYNQSQGQVEPREKFSPLVTADFLSGNTYVSWKIDDRQAHTPPLTEARDEVIQYIRLKEARIFAAAEAESIATRASEDGNALAELVPEGKAENYYAGLGPFKWLDSRGFGVTIGNVPELDSVGEEFMEAVFHTEVGDYDVAPNQPQRVYYVVRPTKFEPSLDELRQQFREPVNRRQLAAVNAGAGEVINDFFESIDQRSGYTSMFEEQLPR